MERSQLRGVNRKMKERKIKKCFKLKKGEKTKIQK